MGGNKKTYSISSNKTIKDFLKACEWRYLFTQNGRFGLYYKGLFIAVLDISQGEPSCRWKIDRVSKKYSQFTHMAKIDFKENIVKAFSSVYHVKVKRMWYSNFSFDNSYNT